MSNMNNPIVQENLLQGTLDWQMTMFEFEYPESQIGSPLIRGLRSAVIEGYASRTSVYPGGNITFMVSTNPARSFFVDIYRLGYYDGKGGRHIMQLGPLTGETQPLPMESIERLRDCNWHPCVTLQIPDDWLSGVYLAKLTLDSQQRSQSYMIFVVKQKRKAEILLQVSDLTWQAYNKWPGTNSLYDDGSPYAWYQGPNVRVGFNRPYARYCQIVDAPLSSGTGEFLLWEFPLAFWLEAEGYDVTYCSNLDLHYEPDLLKHCDVFISSGHDEYWSREMYQNATAARDAGTSLLFMSGNAMYHEILPFYSDNKAVPFRSFARKQRFSDDYELMGSASFGPGYGDWTVAKPEHWVFAGTGMNAGDSIPGLIGWEYHGAPFKAFAGLEVLAQSKLIGTMVEPFAGVRSERGDGNHAATIYPGNHDNWVFNAGTIWWAQGLSSPPGHVPAMGTYGRVQGPDPRVRQITRNLLERCIKR